MNDNRYEKVRLIFFFSSILTIDSKTRTSYSRPMIIRRKKYPNYAKNTRIRQNIWVKRRTASNSFPRTISSRRTDLTQQKEKIYPIRFFSINQNFHSMTIVLIRINASYYSYIWRKKKKGLNTCMHYINSKERYQQVKRPEKNRNRAKDRV